MGAVRVEFAERINQIFIADFRCVKRRIISIIAAGSAGIFARRLLIQMQSAVNLPFESSGTGFYSAGHDSGFQQFSVKP